MEQKTHGISVRLTGLLVLFISLSYLLGCAPTISNIEPSVGVPGDKVLITGGKLTVGSSNPSNVDFNGTIANFKAVGDSVEAVVPKGATSGPVHVKTDYVDFYSPGGTATSPFNFTVVKSAYTEKENNNTRKLANNAKAAQLIKGNITYSDVDWFKITSGSSGPWGYAIEITADSNNLSKDAYLRVDMEGYRADVGGVSKLATYHDDKAFTLWTTQAPNTDIFLKVSWVGSTSQALKANYTLKISRIKNNDSNETDDSFNVAKEIKMTNGKGVHKTSYLCNIFKKGTDVGMKDFYYFNAGGATKISAVVLSPPLHQKDGVIVDLYDNAKGYRGGDQGNYVSAAYDYKLTGGQKAFGNWYVEVTNAWDHYATAGAYGANGSDKLPLSCKQPYTIMVIAE